VSLARRGRIGPYVGGKPRNKQKSKGPQKGWLQTRKTPVVSFVQRGGNIRSFVTADVTSNNLARILRKNITV
jgi:ISXO2 transposase-like protein